jgi:hypothetical protein
MTRGTKELEEQVEGWNNGNSGYIQIKPPRGVPDPSKLIFIPVAVVSGEHQEKDGSSLNDQENRMKKALEILGAKFYPQLLIKIQQHRTEGWQRNEYEQIKYFHEVGVDGLKGNAVMYDRYDRYSRDDLEGQIMRRYLRDNNMEFYIQSQRDDLWSPNSNFTAGIHGKASQKVAEDIAVNTIDGKFTALKDGKPLRTYPFLWDYTLDANGKAVPFIREDRAEIFIRMIELIRSRKYRSYEKIVIQMNAESRIWYSGIGRKKKEHKLQVTLLRSLVERDVFHTGIWNDRVPLKNRFTGEEGCYPIAFPMKYKGQDISTPAIQAELKAIIREHRCFTGEKKYDWLSTGITRCRDCGELMQSHSAIPKNGKYKNHYYFCKKCGLLIPRDPFEKSLIDEHELVFKDYDRFEEAIGITEAMKRDNDRKLKERKRSLREIKKRISVIEHNLTSRKLNPQLIEKLSLEHTDLLESKQNAEQEIHSLEAKNDFPSFIDKGRMKAIIEQIRDRALNENSFEEQKDFLRMIYPPHHKDYYVSVWKEEKQFYWKGKSTIVNVMLKGAFKNEGKRKKHVEEQPMIVSIKGLLGRKPTEKECKLLDKKGLLNKIVWYNADLEKLKKTLKLYATNMNCYII